MAGLIPIFLSEEQEDCLARERVFRDRSNPLDCYDDLELVQESLLPLQHEVLHQQLAVFSGQLQLIE